MLGAGGAGWRDRTLAALERQSRPPDGVVCVERPAGSREARAGDFAWLWLLDEGTAPEPDALERLLDALDDLGPLPMPVLLASQVVGPDGSVDRRSLPVPAVARELVVGAVGRRLLAIRAARRGSILVARGGIERCGLPRPDRPGDDLVWTARLLRRDPGLLVPASLVRRGSVDRAAALVSPAGWARLLFGGALRPGEKPWFAFRLAEEALAEIRGGASRRAGAAARRAGPAQSRRRSRRSGA